MRSPGFLAAIVAVGALAPSFAHPASAAASQPPSYLVIAPDRGFLGNAEVRDAFEAFSAGRAAALVFVTDERTKGTLDSALAGLAKGPQARVVVLPLFLSRSDPRLKRAAALLAERSSRASFSWARPYGESYFAVEQLASRLRSIRQPGEVRAIVVGAGATDAASRDAMLEDWERISQAAGAELGLESVKSVLTASPRELGAALADAAKGATRTVIVPFHLGSKLDGMMSFTAMVKDAAPHGADVIDADVTPDASVGLWLAREANRSLPLRAEDTGVVLLAHGADYHWNEAMRQALAPLAAAYRTEPAFSMADNVVIERAVRRLEARGARYIVVLRVFGLDLSFRPTVERLIGADVERGDAPDPHAGHGMGHGHGAAAPPPRILSPAVLATAGGVEDDPLFAQALLERARALSKDAPRETLVLVAHGEGDDARNEHWLKLLASLARQMQAMGGDRFRAIRTGTWREDWPDKRAAAVEQVRGFVQAASADGGRAIVIPARTLGQGPERQLLEGLSFSLGEGFAPLPEFARWAQNEVAAAVAQEQRQRSAAAGPAAPVRAEAGRYSSRSDRTGSTRSARRVGSQAAASATATKSTKTPANVRGSSGLTP